VKHVTIVGTGLIGASIGLGLSEHGLVVTGWDPSRDALEVARERGAINRKAVSLAAAVEGADLVVLASPPASVITALKGLDTNALVFDVAAVKVAVEQAAVHLPRFVGTHPMAGRERAGPMHASLGLFRGAAWIVVPGRASSEDLGVVEEIIGWLGGIPTRLTAEEHDDAIAAVSHLPQVIAASLVEHAANSGGRLKLAAGSFRDLTRVALSEPELWVEILTHNQRSVAGQLRELADSLSSTAGLVEAGDADGLRGLLSDARSKRQLMAPPVVAVRVLLADEPGELGRVGTALAESAVDVRDLQLRHARHGGGGVLTLSVRPGEAEMLRASLVKQGFDFS
jgi:prephenate dehydrogenase